MKKDKCKIDMKITENKKGDGIRIKINTEGKCDMADFDRKEFMRKFEDN